MTFLNPLVLIGLAAAAIPVILHLLNLRKLRVIEFSTLSFLKELQQTKIRRLKLRQLLLLLVRTLLIICVVLAFARPALRGTIIAGIGSQAHSTVVYILDDSFSEAANDEYGQRFKQAKEDALKLVDLLKEGDDAFLVKLSDLPKATIEPAIHDIGALRTAISEAKISVVRRPLDEALHLASRLLEQSSNVNKEVYIISDMQRTLFSGGSPAAQRQSSQLFPPQVHLFVVPVGTKNIANAAIDSVEVATKILEQDKPVTVKAWVKNYGDLPLRDYVVSIYLDGRRAAQRSVSLEAEGSAAVELTATAKRTGDIKGYVELENDNIEYDNRRYFSLHIPDRLNLGLVASSPADAQYLLLALRAEKTDSSQAYINIVQTTPEKLPLLDLKTVDALCCVNVPAFSAEEVDRIALFVKGGGGLIIFPGDGTQITNYNTTLLRDLQIPPVEDVVKLPAASPGLAFKEIDIDHPIFSTMFEHEERRGLRSADIVESPNITAFTRRESGKQGHTIIGMNDGTPFLSEHTFGEGKVLFYSVAPTLSWSDFPLKAVFAPIVFRSAVYVAAPAERQQSFIAGEESVINVEFGTVNRERLFNLVAPDSVSEIVQPSSGASALKGFTPSLAFQPKRFTQLGHYELTTDRKTLALISVNPDAAESDTRKISEEELGAFWTRMGIPPASVTFLRNGSRLEADVLQSRFGIELWKYCIGAALLLALLEMLIARERGNAAAAAQAAGA